MIQLHTYLENFPKRTRTRENAMVDWRFRSKVRVAFAACKPVKTFIDKAIGRGQSGNLCRSDAFM